jgi:hypothetical protein
MANKTCPVCGLEQAETAAACGRCGWDFSPMLGTAEQTRTLLAKRLEEARAAWLQRRYNPELVPELERDPFETPEEFAERLAERPWYVGEAELQKAGYDIKTGRFPLRLKSSLAWVERWLNLADSCHLELGSAASPARLTACPARPNGNTPAAPVLPRPSAPGAASVPLRPISTATAITLAASPRPASIWKRPSRSGATRPIPVGCMTCTVTSGSGSRTAGTTGSLLVAIFRLIK